MKRTGLPAELLLILLLPLHSVLAQDETDPGQSAQWSVDRANALQAEHGGPVGNNLVPRTALSWAGTWQSLPFGPETIDRNAASRGERPNVVFIFIDDLGYGDLSLYRRDGDVGPETEHLDRLAQDGVRFTQFYVSSPICSPSRVAMMTGQYPQRWNIYGHLDSRERNRERGMAHWLSTDAVVLPQLLKDAGYATAHYGKWHMGGQRDVGNAPPPEDYGFDDALVSMEGVGERILEPGGSGLGNRTLGPPEDIRDVPKHNMTEVWVDSAITFARRHKERPFYINLWPRDVHDPFKPSEEELAKVEAPTGVPNPEQWKRFFAVLNEMDRQLGRFVEALDEMGLGEETMIVVTGDNGPTAWSRYYEGERDEGAAPGYTADLRGRKWSLYEGGLREPFFVRWKGHLPAGTVNERTVVAGVDLLPSLASIIGIPLPEEYQSDGVDLSQAMLGASQPIRARPIFWEYNSLGGNIEPGLEKDRSPTLAMRDGSWKVLANADGSGLELYNLAEDRDESTNLVDRYPRRAARMKRRLLQWYIEDLPRPLHGVEKPTHRWEGGR